VRTAADFFSNCGARIYSPHPIDILMLSPMKIIFEAKLVSESRAIFAIRESVGQLYEYRYFFGPTDAKLCVLLNEEPPQRLVTYVEDVHGIQIIWANGTSFTGGPKTLNTLLPVGIALSTSK
jgi:hypothetical protein